MTKDATRYFAYSLAVLLLIIGSSVWFVWDLGEAQQKLIGAIALSGA